jgi:uncharacterized protein YecE (DUF72 family)
MTKVIVSQLNAGYIEGNKSVWSIVVVERHIWYLSFYYSIELVDYNRCHGRDRQYKIKRTDNDMGNTTQKIKIRETQITL